jgi:hypothetical protein
MYPNNIAHVKNLILKMWYHNTIVSPIILQRFLYLADDTWFSQQKWHAGLTIIVHLLRHYYFFIPLFIIPSFILHLKRDRLNCSHENWTFDSIKFWRIFSKFGGFQIIYPFWWISEIWWIPKFYLAFAILLLVDSKKPIY